MKKLIIIGAPRSGTNMLRDLIASIPGYETWPCDEINYIWRHGNVRFPSDEFTADMATPDIARYIQRQFEKFGKASGAETVVEKTCANSLRVPFVNQAVDDARYLFIYRNGLDVIASAQKRWTATLDIPYLLKKTRYVPFSDLPYYGLRYFKNRVVKIFSKNDQLAFWGPALENMQEILEKHSLEEVCALQWQACLTRADAALANFADDRVCRLQYEKLVTEPVAELTRVCNFLDIAPEKLLANEAVKGISADSINKGIQYLEESTLQSLQTLIGDTLQKYGYQ